MNNQSITIHQDQLRRVSTGDISTTQVGLPPSTGLDTLRMHRAVSQGAGTPRSSLSGSTTPVRLSRQRRIEMDLSDSDFFRKKVLERSLKSSSGSSSSSDVPQEENTASVPGVLEAYKKNSYKDKRYKFSIPNEYKGVSFTVGSVAPLVDDENQAQKGEYHIDINELGCLETVLLKLEGSENPVKTRKKIHPDDARLDFSKTILKNDLMFGEDSECKSIDIDCVIGNVTITLSPDVRFVHIKNCKEANLKIVIDGLTKSIAFTSGSIEARVNSVEDLEDGDDALYIHVDNIFESKGFTLFRDEI